MKQWRPFALNEQHAVGRMTKDDPELMRLLEAESVARERTLRFRGYPTDITKAAEELLAEAIADVHAYGGRKGNR